MKIPSGQSPGQTWSVCQIWWLSDQRLCKIRKHKDRQTDGRQILFIGFIMMVRNVFQKGGHKNGLLSLKKIELRKKIEEKRIRKIRYGGRIEETGWKIRTKTTFVCLFYPKFLMRCDFPKILQSALYHAFVM